MFRIVPGFWGWFCLCVFLPHKEWKKKKKKKHINKILAPTQSRDNPANLFMFMCFSFSSRMVAEWWWMFDSLERVWRTKHNMLGNTDPLSKTLLLSCHSQNIIYGKSHKSHPRLSELRKAHFQKRRGGNDGKRVSNSIFNRRQKHSGATFVENTTKRDARLQNEIG